MTKFIHTCVCKNSSMSKDTIFYLLWYNVIRWSSHINRKSSFLSFDCLLFLLNNTEEVAEYKIQSVTQMNEMKNVIIQVSYFMNVLILNLLFYCHIILFLEKLASYEKFSHLWSSNCLKNFNVSILLMEVSKWWKIAEIPKISIKIKNFKTLYETQRAGRLKEIIQFPTR